ncbi:GntR family transcriptional regulator [Alteromonas facilis]|uniref:GntR family transcriptional regulator n=1 Tax=Alteromonas facilis TaxID=2048004 RepID=UPI000C288D54|nr:GntR family transcriptional regulator [Alteromonas facilis]
MVIDKSLRDKVKDSLMNELFTGELKPGQKINIAALARHLGVSPTPVRESLFGLSERGILKFANNVGFSLNEYSFETAAECYQLLSSLEGMALKMSEEFSSREVFKLNELLMRLEFEASTKSVSFETLSSFENALISKCRNKLLKRTCNELRYIAFPYEHLVLSSVDDLKVAFDAHKEIVRLIENGKFLMASSLLANSWQSCLPYLKGLLEKDV